MSKAKIIKSPYQPRPLQQRLHESLERFSVIVAHRRFGKTVFTINHLIIQAFKNPLPRPQYAYVGPEKSQTKKVAWEYLKTYTAHIPEVRHFEAELKVEFPTIAGSKATIYLEGAENPDRLRGMYFDGVVLDEVAQMPKSVWTEVLRPALSDRKGWALFIGTPKGKNYFKQLYERGGSGEQGWRSFILKASETNVIAQEELESVRRDLDEETYQQEYECSFDAALPGSYYGKLITRLRSEGSIGDYSWNPKYPVITAWDLGLNDMTVIWFAQFINNKVYLVDYYAASGEALTHYLNLVKAKPYVYDYHILPHDVRQRNFSTGATRLDEIQNSGLKVRVAPKLSVQDGINAVRNLLPICNFNAKLCEDGLNALSYYHSVYSDRNDVQQLVPVHDWSSHASDAFRYLAVGSRPGVFQSVVTQKMFGEDNTPKEYEDFDPLK